MVRILKKSNKECFCCLKKETTNIFKECKTVLTSAESSINYCGQVILGNKL